eukprot:8939634-Alexandrium_andersonii.AAC.1
MPTELRPGWWHIVRHRTRGEHDRAAEGTADWIELHGRELGFRAPTVAERGRSLGIWEYLHGIGLTERQIFDAQGNLFDPMAVATRIADP